MSDKNYSKRELDHYFKDLNETLKQCNETLSRIETQTIKTNGRVSRLEWWRGAVIWALGALWAVVIALGPWLFATIQNHIKVTVDESVSSALAQYEIIVER